MNLVSNSLKFTDRNGKIDIKIERITSNDKQNELKISVTDDGLGIKVKDQNKIFQLFGCIKDE